jgi:phage-related protein
MRENIRTGLTLQKAILERKRDKIFSKLQLYLNKLQDLSQLSGRTSFQKAIFKTLLDEKIAILVEFIKTKNITPDKQATLEKHRKKKPAILGFYKPKSWSLVKKYNKCTEKIEEKSNLLNFLHGNYGY